MKITNTFISIFLVTFLIGFTAVPTMKKEKVVSVESANTVLEEVSTPPTQQKIEPQAADEIVDWQEEDESKLKIKLLETGEGFHGDQVNAKPGETWLGLFKENDKYFLRSTKLTIHRVHDPIVDESENIKTGKSVSTSQKAPTVFLLKYAKMLREGEIKTVFFADDYDESTSLENGIQKNFEFNGENYILRVENKITSDKYLGKGSKLILSHHGKEQILSFLKDGCNDCTWNLFWVGDIDRDGKLDFYFDLSWHYNIIDKKLFLSSQAEKGKIVKYVANFWTNGC